MLLVAAAGLIVAFRHQIAHQVAAAAAKQPTPLTELFFSNPNGLPKSLSLSHPNRFRFTVVNREGHATDYSYVVTLSSSSGSSTVARGRIDLRSGEAATRLVDFAPTERATQYVATVSLVGRKESIRFAGATQ